MCRWSLTKNENGEGDEMRKVGRGSPGCFASYVHNVEIYLFEKSQ